MAFERFSINPSNPSRFVGNNRVPASPGSVPMPPMARRPFQNMPPATNYKPPGGFGGGSAPPQTGGPLPPYNPNGVEPGPGFANPNPIFGEPLAPRTGPRIYNGPEKPGNWKPVGGFGGDMPSTGVPLPPYNPNGVEPGPGFARPTPPSFDGMRPNRPTGSIIPPGLKPSNPIAWYNSLGGLGANPNSPGIGTGTVSGNNPRGPTKDPFQPAAVSKPAAGNAANVGPFTRGGGTGYWTSVFMGNKNWKDIFAALGSGQSNLGKVQTLGGSKKPSTPTNQKPTTPPPVQPPAPPPTQWGNPTAPFPQNPYDVPAPMVPANNPWLASLPQRDWMTMPSASPGYQQAPPPPPWRPPY